VSELIVRELRLRSFAAVAPAAPHDTRRIEVSRGEVCARVTASPTLERLAAQHSRRRLVAEDRELG
jgi:hypothetical protein